MDCKTCVLSTQPVEILAVDCKFVRWNIGSGLLIIAGVVEWSVMNVEFLWNIGGLGILFLYVWISDLS